MRVDVELDIADEALGHLEVRSEGIDAHAQRRHAIRELLGKIERRCPFLSYQGLDPTQGSAGRVKVLRNRLDADRHGRLS